jgi:DNA polymerase III subunit gamma/tau
MSFYRTYRPQVIEEIDNLAVRETILSFLTKDKKELPHAYLFSGPRGAGKTTAARLIAKVFNCEKPAKSGPCGSCEQCKSIAEGKNLDVLEIDAASNRGIDEIRALRDAIGLSPASADFRVYIIDEVHMLTTEAFNALLKTLEEPPAHAVFILATTDPQKVPVTIKSRCVSIVFSRATAAELVSALDRIVKKEKIDIDPPALSAIAEVVDGSFRDAVKYLEQVSFHKGTISVEIVYKLLALSEEKSRDNFLTLLANRNAKDALATIGQLVSQGKDMRVFTVDCLHALEKLLVSGKLAGWDKTQLVRVIRKLSQAYGEMKNTAIPQLPLELAVVEFCEDEPVLSMYAPVAPVPAVAVSTKPVEVESVPIGSLSLEKLIEHWADVIAELKPYNHSIAGVMRSTRPKTVAGGIVTVEAFYTFHRDKLAESKTKDVLSAVLKKLFGEKVKIEVVLGKK